MSREGKIATAFFNGFKGHLQADGYRGYNELAQTKDVIRVACWAHAHRKFIAITKTTKKSGVAHFLGAKLSQLYKIEKENKENHFNVDHIRNRRQKYAKPILEGLKTWLEDKQPHIPPKNPLGQAISYTLERWGPLTEYLNHGHLDIDNNFAERSIRPFTMGRKNWVFMGNERGGKAAAVLYSLIETAKAKKLNTYSYFRYLLTHFPATDPKDLDALKKLLPSQITSTIIEGVFK